MDKETKTALGVVGIVGGLGCAAAVGIPMYLNREKVKKFFKEKILGIVVWQVCQDNQVIVTSTDRIVAFRVPVPEEISNVRVSFEFGNLQYTGGSVYVLRNSEVIQEFLMHAEDRFNKESLEFPVSPGDEVGVDVKSWSNGRQFVVRNIKVEEVEPES